MQENCDNQRHPLFDKSKIDTFLKKLNRDLHLLTIRITLKTSIIILQQLSQLRLISSLLKLHIKRIIELPTLDMIIIVKLVENQLGMFLMNL